MRQAGLIQTDRLQPLFEAIAPDLIRFPAVDAPSFRAAVREFCQAPIV
jgi:hypothetical protein